MNSFILTGFFLSISLAFGTSTILLSREEFTDICKSAVRVYMVGFDVMLPEGFLDEVQNNLKSDTAKEKVKSIAENLKEATLSSRLADKAFIEILHIANSTYHALRTPANRLAEGYFDSFLSLFENVASWFFLFMATFRRAADEGMPIKRSNQLDNFAENVCQIIPMPPPVDFDDPASWRTAGSYLFEQFTSLFNSTSLEKNPSVMTFDDIPGAFSDEEKKATSFQ
ncbi:uncharacterized protein LOC141855857 [Brevipalpus obovatus]|uniref:uncharacterized protein LOC141855857 n=1 Tax=Brevipalpus obovatus TaxID=246614 RepID=UPI003D9F197A